MIVKPKKTKRKPTDEELFLEHILGSIKRVYRSLWKKTQCCECEKWFALERMWEVRSSFRINRLGVKISDSARALDLNQVLVQIALGKEMGLVANEENSEEARGSDRTVFRICSDPICNRCAATDREKGKKVVRNLVLLGGMSWHCCKEVYVSPSEARQ